MERQLQELAQSEAWEPRRRSIVDAAWKERGGTDVDSLQEQQQLDKEAAARQRSERLRRLAREARAERARLEALEAARFRVLRAAPPEAEARGDVAEARARSARNAGGAPRRACLLPPPSPCSSPLPPQVQRRARRQLVCRATNVSDSRRVAYVETSNAFSMSMTMALPRASNNMPECVAAVAASAPIATAAVN